jgi:AraC-like DNA-binding protein
MDEKASSTSPSQVERFSTLDFATPELGLQGFRELSRAFAEVTPLGDIKDFRVSTATVFLNGAVMVDVETSAMRYDRTPQHVAFGIDHYQLLLHLRGGAEIIVNDRAFLQGTGDVCLLDMAQPSLTREIQAEDGSVQVLNFLLPRMVLALLLPPTDRAAAIRILPQDTGYGRLLRDFMLTLRQSAPGLSQSESQAAVQALAHLVAASPMSAEEPATYSSREILRARINLYIETNLGSAALDVDRLYTEFGLSRAALYRLFEPESPLNYIQHRRLQRALAMLISPAFRSWRIIDIALDCQFSSDATFIRAFRRGFGLSPGEARRLAAESRLDPMLKVEPTHPQPDEEAVRWIRRITGTMLTGPTQ